MPRRLYERRFWERIEERASRLPKGVESRWRPLTKQPGFIDYWSSIPATIPEKMVFAELVRRQINFYFSPYFGDIPFTPDRERWRPDFYLPDYHVVIEVFGIYWHSRPGSYEYDANKALIYTAAGYKHYILLDYEVLANVRAALDKIPEVAYGGMHGNMAIVGDRPFNPNAAIGARMRKWPKKFVTQYREPRNVTALPPEGSWQSRTGARAPKADYWPIFMGVDDKMMDIIEEWLKKWEAYAKKYRRYYRKEPPSLHRDEWW